MGAQLLLQTDWANGFLNSIFDVLTNLSEDLFRFLDCEVAERLSIRAPHSAVAYGEASPEEAFFKGGYYVDLIDVEPANRGCLQQICK